MLRNIILISIAAALYTVSHLKDLKDLAPKTKTETGGEKTMFIKNNRTVREYDTSGYARIQDCPGGNVPAAYVVTATETEPAPPSLDELIGTVDEDTGGVLVGGVTNDAPATENAASDDVQLEGVGEGSAEIITESVNAEPAEGVDLGAVIPENTIDAGAPDDGGENSNGETPDGDPVPVVEPPLEGPGDDLPTGGEKADADPFIKKIEAIVTDSLNLAGNVEALSKDIYEIYASLIASEAENSKLRDTNVLLRATLKDLLNQD